MRIATALKDCRYLVVGSGFFGSVIAERIANDMREKVVVIEKRGHIGGNSYSYFDKETGIECHKYGTHIFHTSIERVWKYICRFTGFTNYQHKVLTEYKGKVYAMPINLGLINSFYGLNLRPEEAKKFIAREIGKEKIACPGNLEEQAISLIGRGLYEAFIKGYTAKQWKTDLRSLPADIFTRLPIRYDYNSCYFSDIWQGMPCDGYTEIFNRILNNENITVFRNTDYYKIARLIPKNCFVVFTGPIDHYFGHRHGKLGWRSLYFKKEILNVPDHQGTSVMNYAEESVPYTRIHEFKHLHRERNYKIRKTVILKEYPKGASRTEDELYYPVNTCNDKEIYLKYLNESRKLRNVLFGGRLGSYRYFDIDRTIDSALETYEKEIKGRRPNATA